MKAKLLTKLTADLAAAKEDARRSIADMADGGTSNMDGVLLSVGRGLTITRQAASVAEAIAAAGMSAVYHAGRMRRGYLISVGLGGQGSTRTVAAESVCRSMQDRGWDVSMWYEID